MLKAMRGVVGAVAAVSLLGGAPAHAQYTPRSPLTQQARPGPRPPPRVRTPEQQPLFELFGLPVYLAAPVAAPYANSAFQTYGGQPRRSSESVLQGAP